MLRCQADKTRMEMLRERKARKAANYHRLAAIVAESASD